jgi:hypothetical protein
MIEDLKLKPEMALPELFMKTMEKINEIIMVLNEIESGSNLLKRRIDGS